MKIAWLTKAISIAPRFIKWGKDVATEGETASSSRVVMLMVSTTVCVLLLGFFFTTHKIPQADQLYGLSAVLAVGSGAYATNRIRQDSGTVAIVPVNNTPPPDGGPH